MKLSLFQERHRMVIEKLFKHLLECRCLLLVVLLLSCPSPLFSQNEQQPGDENKDKEESELEAKEKAKAKAKAKAKEEQEKLAKKINQIKTKLLPGLAIVTHSMKRIQRLSFCVHQSGYFIVQLSGADNDFSLADEVRVFTVTKEEARKEYTGIVIRCDKKKYFGLIKINEKKIFQKVDIDDGNEKSSTDLIFMCGMWMRSMNLNSTSLHMEPVTRSPSDSKEKWTIDTKLKGFYSTALLVSDSGNVVGFPVMDHVRNKISAVHHSSDILDFLSDPEISIQPPYFLCREDEEPSALRIKVLEFVANQDALTIEVVMDDGSVKLPVKEEDGIFSADFKIPENKHTLDITVTVDFGDSYITGVIKNQKVTVNQQAISFDQIVEIELGDKPKVILNNGMTISGTIDGMNTMAINVGKTVIELPLKDAISVHCKPHRIAESIWYSIAISRGEKSLLKTKKQIPIYNMNPNVLADEWIHWSSNGTETEPLSIALPGPIRDAVVGGGGRYWIFLLSGPPSVAILDLNLMRIVRTISVSNDNIIMAAGRRKLILMDNSTRTIERWDLLDLIKDSSVPMEFKGAVTSVTVGNAADAPILISCWESSDRSNVTKLYFVDQWTLEFNEFKQSSRNAIKLKASPDGTSYGMWDSRGFTSIVHRDNDSDVVERFVKSDSKETIIPGRYGLQNYCQSGIYDRRLLHMDATLNQFEFLITSIQGHYFLLREKKSPDSLLILYVTGAQQPLYYLTDLPIDQAEMDQKNGILTADQCFHFVPHNNLLLWLSQTDNSIKVFHLNIEEKLKEAELDYLYISNPIKLQGVKGTSYKHQLIIKSENDGIIAILDSGPEGLTLSEDGMITWAIPDDFQHVDALFEVSISDNSRQKRKYSFRIQILK